MEEKENARRWAEFEKNVCDALNYSSIDALLRMPDFIGAKVITDIVRSLVDGRAVERAWFEKRQAD